MENIKQKIQASLNAAAILTVAEKKEWLGLLDFMTEHQLLELERILLETAPPVVKPAVLPVAPKPAPVISSTTPKTQSATDKKSPFSHILNMPKGRFVNPAQQNLLKNKTKPDSPFLKKLKVMFAEKELPSGHMAELPAGVVKVKSEPVAQVPNKILPKPPVIPKPVPLVVAKQPTFSDLSKVKPENLLSKISDFEKKSSIAQAPSQPPVQNFKTSVSTIMGQPAAVQKAPIKNNVEPVLKFNAQILPVTENVEGDLTDDVNLQTFDDVKKITVADFETHSDRSFFNKLQKLIAQHSLYEVMVNLESSPLYKAYVETGSKWLKDNTRADVDSGTLAQKDFERFADLLILLKTKG